MAKTEFSSDEKLLSIAKERYKTANQGWDHIFKAATSDLNFVYDVGEGQWPVAVRNKREKDGRPVVTVNKLLKFVRQLRGEASQNRPRIKVIPVDDKSDPEKAELFNGIIRQIEYLSDAGIAYDTSYMHAVSSSVGVFRIVSKFADDDYKSLDQGLFNQDLFIKRILNPQSVKFDPRAVEFELEDGKYCFIEELVERKEFERLYPDAKVGNWDAQKRMLGEWIQGEAYRVAEYYYKDPVRRRIVQVANGNIYELTKEQNPEFIQANYGPIVRERIVDTHVVKWLKTNGHEILKEGVWPGKHIPVIPVFGDEIVVDGKKYYLSLTRGAKGSQQMYNYWATAATEAMSLTPKTPFIVDHRQIEGYEPEWSDAHKTNRPFLRYNAIKGIEKPQRERQTEIPSGIITMMTATAYDIEDHLGRYEASKGQASNERSGKAIIARIQQADKGTFTFIDNYQRAIVYAGRQLIDLIPKIYDTPRALRIRGEDDSEQLVKVNQPGGDVYGNATINNDLKVGKYDVISTVGATYSSRRQEMVEMMIQAMQYAPNVAHIIAPLIFKYADYPGAKEISAEIEKAVENMPIEERSPKGAKSR